jgi:Tfp pilus assembly protein FimT
LALPNFATFQTSFQLMSATRTTAQFVRLARAIAVGRNLPSRIVISQSGSTMTTQIFRNGAWASIGTPMVLTGGTSVSAVQPSASALSFSAQGIAAGTVTITLRASRGDQKSLVVSLLGSVDAA